MRIVIACLIVISMCLSCTIIDDSMKRRDEKSKIVKRRDEVSRIMKNHYRGYGFDYGFEIEGPFTIEQCKEHYIKRDVERFGISEQKPEIRKKLLDRIKRFPDSQKFKDFVRPVVSHKGNELYFFTSDIYSWGALNGREGYVIVYKNELVDKIVTGIN
ncbi:MAG: hypothetical protein GY774_17280 [Planctomycetes bacterium]|nr:hypothetical protein [Planctomycetota bacterium]